MRQIKFTEAEIMQLKHESIYHEHALVRRRMVALLLKAEGLAHAKIGERLGICPKTLRKYLDTFLKGAEMGRVEALKGLKYKGKPNRLMEKKEEIIAHLEENPPSTQKEAQAKIKELQQAYNGPCRRWDAGHHAESGLARKNVGIGLRIGNSRSGLGNIIHVDLAFPLDGGPTIVNVQIVVVTKERF